MTYTRWARLGLLLIIVLIWALPASSYEENVVDISKGTVFAVDNDSSGNVIAVSILDATGEEYFVVRGEIGDQLLKMVDKNIKVTGVISIGKDGKKHIEIRKFELVHS
jgi:hypothetical protein